MLNPELFLNQNVFNEDVEKQPTRDGFGKGLVKAGEKNKNIVALTADLKESTRIEEFANKFPERFFEVGVAEQNLITIAAGLANSNKIPFASSYATFSPGRNWEQIRTTVCYNNVNVKIIGAHAGLLTGPDGVTHQATEDLALMLSLPNMKVVVPVDYYEAYKATLEIAKINSPCYLRLSRPKIPVITTEKTPFEFNKIQTFWISPNPQVTIIATGSMVYYSLIAAQQLEKQGIETEVINCSTLKPLDKEEILKHFKITKAAVTVEEHQTHGGLSSLIANLITTNFLIPQEIVAIDDTFSESGDPEELLDKYGLNTDNIKKAVLKAIARKKQ